MLFVLTAFTVVTFFFTRNDPPEQLAIELMKRQLLAQGKDVSLVNIAECTNELGTKDDQSSGVAFYHNCDIGLQATSENLVFRIAFNSRGSIEFWEANRLKR